MATTFPEDTRTVRAVRRFCLDCQGAQPDMVRTCEETSCALHPWRLPDAVPAGEDPGRAIRACRRHCLACAGDRREARSCDANGSCPLWPYRFGVQPATYKRVSMRMRAPRPLLLPGLKTVG